jgi:IS30 family transposase
VRATNPESARLFRKGLRLCKIENAIAISEQPPGDRGSREAGAWEGDLLVGANNSYIAALVERHSRFVMLAKVPNKDTQSFVAALI